MKFRLLDRSRDVQLIALTAGELFMVTGERLVYMKVYDPATPECIWTVNITSGRLEAMGGRATVHRVEPTEEIELEVLR